MMQTGKVWLAGAGPGSVELLTVKAWKLIKAGDCIVYDRLVGNEILSMIPADTELINVGNLPDITRSRRRRSIRS